MAVDFQDFCQNRDPFVCIQSVDPSVMAEYHSQHKSPEQALAALKWLISRLYLPWPVDSIEAPNDPGTAIFGRQSAEALCPEPGLFFKLEECLVDAAKAREPHWLAYLAVWLQTTACVHLGLSQCGSFPVRVFLIWRTCTGLSQCEYFPLGWNSSAKELIIVMPRGDFTGALRLSRPMVTDGWMLFWRHGSSCHSDCSTKEPLDSSFSSRPSKHLRTAYNEVAFLSGLQSSEAPRLRH